MKAHTVWALPCSSQECDEGPRLRQQSPDRLVLAYDFETETGDYVWEELVFAGVVGFSFTSSQGCSVEQVTAYDEVQDVTESAWIKSIHEPPRGLRHYRIYFDEAGCYDVLATGLVPPV